VRKAAGLELTQIKGLAVFLKPSIQKGEMVKEVGCGLAKYLKTKKPRPSKIG
jgi:hypothetical protein